VLQQKPFGFLLLVQIYLFASAYSVRNCIIVKQCRTQAMIKNHSTG